MRHTQASKQIERENGLERVRLPAARAPEEALLPQLTFALKNEGLNLCLLAQLFRHHIHPQTVAEWVHEHPTSKPVRRLWFLYEWLTERRVPADDLAQGNYVPLADESLYYTVPGQRHRRQRILFNLPGTADFCPLIRRTPKLDAFDDEAFRRRCEKVINRYPQALMKRALAWLFTKETRSSFAIESITPNATRTERFIALLHLAEKEDFCSKEALIDLQNRIVDERFADHDWRSSQNYVGQTTLRGEKVHYVPPPPDQVPGMMNSLCLAHGRMEMGNFPVLAHAAAVSFGFVFIHPFEDGNGRIHRFLLHNIFARRGLAPEGVIFPISAVMHRRPDQYDALLEAFSRPLMLELDYQLDEQGRISVAVPFPEYYRYPDLTLQTEGLLDFMEETLEKELTEELDFLQRHDSARTALREIVDLPDRQLDLFIRLCLHNSGRLSRTKREKFFDMLSDDEVRQLEATLREHFNDQSPE
ncbi:Fic family protein [Sulfurivirga sp.]|uniref:Fic family protein n=1 Tax=Sulfurivirga sp. TaxID=2614236 RepID=UPI0025F7023A|nr:Fic family protein [Sulfurivirga sp.]